MKIFSAFTSSLIGLLVLSGSALADDRPSRSSMGWGEPGSNANEGAPVAENLLTRVLLAFEENRGQFDPRVQYLARGPGYRIFLGKSGATISIDAADSKKTSAAVRMRFIGASPTAAVGVDRLGQVTNYFVGGQTIRNYTDVPNFAKVAYRSIYPGVDVVFYGNKQELEYDLVVAPNADPGPISLQLQGANSLALVDDGDLRLSTKAGYLLLRRPVAYQEVDGMRVPVPVDYVIRNKNTVAFRIAAYDLGKPLVIDPILTYSTYLTGSAGAQPKGIAVDASGHAYVVGTTSSTDFPTASAYQSRKAGSADVFVTKFNANGTGVLYSTYLGGSKSNNVGSAISIDASGNAYITGTVTAATFPITSGAYQTTGSNASSFVAKLGPLGNTLVYSTYLNGASARAVAVDPAGYVYVAGSASSAFAATTGSFQTVNRGSSNGFIIKLNTDGTAASYSTFLGGSGADAINGIALDASGSAYVAGDAGSTDFPLSGPYQGYLRGTTDAFVAKINSAGNGVVYSTYLGGANRESGKAVAVDASGSAYVAGVTYSMDFPTVNGFQARHGLSGIGTSTTGLDNAFIAKLDPSGSALAYSSYLGGAGCLSPSINTCLFAKGDGANSIAVDSQGNAFIGGYASSVSFPVVDSLNQPKFDNNIYMPFIAKVVSASNGGAYLGYSVVLGRDDLVTSAGTLGVAVDGQGNVYGAGNAYPSIGYPVTPGAFQSVPGQATATMGFVAKLRSAPFRTTLGSARNPACQGDSIQLTAAIADANASGEVVFYDGPVNIGTAQVSGGLAKLTTVLPVGVHSLSATFSGDGKSSLPTYQTVRLPAACL